MKAFYALPSVFDTIFTFLPYFLHHLLVLCQKFCILLAGNSVFYSPALGFYPGQLGSIFLDLFPLNQEVFIIQIITEVHCGHYVFAPRFYKNVFLVEHLSRKKRKKKDSQECLVWDKSNWRQKWSLVFQMSIQSSRSCKQLPVELLSTPASTSSSLLCSCCRQSLLEEVWESVQF